MRITLLSWTVALMMVSSTAQAQYGMSPAQPYLHPENPAIFGQIDFEGRVSSIEGDEARYQRYRDLRDGVFFDLTGLHQERGGFVLLASARNVGWRDQR